MSLPDVTPPEVTSPEVTPAQPTKELSAPKRGAMGWKIAAALLSLSILFTPKLLRDPGKEGGSRAASRIVKVAIGPGETLSSILVRFGVDEAAAGAIVEALRPLVTPRDIPAGQHLQVFLDGQSKTLIGVEFPLSTAVLKVVGTPEGWSAERKEIPSTSATQVIRGVLSRNLYKDGRAAGLSPAQIMELADIFQYDIDFFSDLQRGDLFSVAFEGLRYENGWTEPKRILAAELTVGGRRFHAFHYTNEEGKDGYYDIDGRSLRRAFLRAPLHYRSISSRYTRRRFHPILRVPQPHQAIDYGAAPGTPVVSVGRGTVRYAGWNGGYGQFVEVLHSNGYRSRYAHFSRIAPGIQRGARVDQGQVIGYVGQTGLATGPHLHFELLRGQTKINFLSLRIPANQQLEGEEMNAFANVRDEHLALLRDAEFQLARSYP